MIAESPLARKIMEEKSEEIKAQTIPLEAKEATIYGGVYFRKTKAQFIA
jgi:hypothetical protein